MADTWMPVATEFLDSGEFITLLERAAPDVAVVSVERGERGEWSIVHLGGLPVEGEVTCTVYRCGEELRAEWSAVERRAVS